mmetsp:Transcript_46329/g.75619  ORF Transcript_46329/g.75619 Transcript_46329/m.75619 type:complete len:227 (+) Transcript_46329:1121-1801(+)
MSWMPRCCGPAMSAPFAAFMSTGAKRWLSTSVSTLCCRFRFCWSGSRTSTRSGSGCGGRRSSRGRGCRRGMPSSPWTIGPSTSNSWINAPWAPECCWEKSSRERSRRPTRQRTERGRAQHRTSRPQRGQSGLPSPTPPYTPMSTMSLATTSNTPWSIATRGRRCSHFGNRSWRTFSALHLTARTDRHLSPTPPPLPKKPVRIRSLPLHPHPQSLHNQAIQNSPCLI